MAILPVYAANSSDELTSYIESNIHLDFSKEEDMEKYKSYSEEAQKILAEMKDSNNAAFSDLTDEQFEEYINLASELHQLCEDGIEKEEEFNKSILLDIISDYLNDTVEEEKTK